MGGVDKKTGEKKSTFHVRFFAFLRIIRMLGSGVLWTYSFVFVTYGIFAGYGQFDIHVVLAYIIFLCSVFLLGLMEGLQISLVKCVDIPPETLKDTHKIAYSNVKLISRRHNMPRFLMGRQVFVVGVVFFGSRLSNFPDMVNHPFSSTPMPEWYKSFIVDAGLLAVVLLSILAQLTPQLVAEALPIESLNLWGLSLGIWACILLEYTGVVHASYVFKWIIVRFFCCSYRKTKKISKAEKTLTDRDFKAMADLMKSWSDGEGGIAVERGYDDDDDDEDQIAKVTPEELQMLKWKVNFPLTTSVDESEQRITKITRHAQDNPDEYKKFPIIIGDRAYPSTSMIAESLEKKGIQVPPFLLPVSSPDHVPPHITCCQLMIDNIQLKKSSDKRGATKKTSKRRTKKIVEPSSSSSSSEPESSSEYSSEDQELDDDEESSDYVTDDSSDEEESSS